MHSTVIDHIDYVTTTHMSRRVNTSLGGTLCVALTKAAEQGSTQASVGAMAKLRQRNESFTMEECY